MSKITLYFFICFSAFCLGQDYNHVDKKVQNYPNFDTLDHLAQRITNDFDSDKDRVRAAFVWIAHNIRYGKTMDEFFGPKQNFIYYSERGRKRQLEKILDENIDYAFKNKIGVCSDYSMMLKKLCNIFKIESHIVRGIAKEDIRDITGEKVYKNHAWNAIKLNHQWKLMDPTWASGYWDETKKQYVHAYDEHYFDTDPKEFIKDHFPAQTKWQLLKEPITLNSFYTAPIFFPGYFKNDVELSSHISGLLVLPENMELVFAFEKLPHRTQLRYSIDSDVSQGRIQNLYVRKQDKKLFISKLKLKNVLKIGQKLTLYIDKNPILRFGVDE